MVDVFASAVVVWELHGATRTAEKLALRLIGSGYFLLAVYVSFDAAHSLAAR